MDKYAICIVLTNLVELFNVVQLYSVLFRRKNSTDCDDAIGCAVDVTRFEEEYSDYNSVYGYRIRNFTDEMNGNYTLQCTNRTHDNRITNYVRLVILGKI